MQPHLNIPKLSPGKRVPAKIMGPPCSCRMNCGQKVSEADREQLYNLFWNIRNWEQRKQYIALPIKVSPKNRARCRNNVDVNRRQVTFTYSLAIAGQLVTVCKAMFISTYAVSEKFVRDAIEKKRLAPGGVIGPDQRGKRSPKIKKSEAVKEVVREHIRSFPAERLADYDDTGRTYLDAGLNVVAMYNLYLQQCRDRGLPESDLVKESYYREIFKTEFNLGFKRLWRR